MTQIETLKTGTTTVGIISKDAVVLATERKATIGYTIDSKQARKVYKLDDHIGMTIAGSVGDAAAVVRLLKAQFKLFKLERGPISMKAASALLQNILQGNKYFPFMNMFILGGYDAEGPALFSIDPVGGASTSDKFYSTGSGSPFAYGVLESGFKEGMSTEEVIGLALKSVRTAIERDIGSGGKGFWVAVIDANGYRELSENEIRQYSK